LKLLSEPKGWGQKKKIKNGGEKYEIGEGK
jgi:hypothetical protein